MDKKQMRIQHTFTQRYTNWKTPVFIDNFEARVSTFDIMERRDGETVRKKKRPFLDVF